MVEVIEEKKSFNDDKITQDTFLSSVKSWYPNGVHVGVEACYPFKQKGFKDGNRINLPIIKQGFVIKCSILGEMDRCRARVLDANGKAQKIEDAMGNLVDDIEVLTDEIDAVTFFIKGVNFTDDGDLTIGSLANAFEFINPLFISSGLLPSDNKKGIKFTLDEFMECVEGYEFIAKCGKNPKSKYLHLVAENI